jgi:pyruvate/2-oxoglutarate dehydrogenase complex dihydrolipoamide acyltransferase (E2) component
MPEIAANTTEAVLSTWAVPEGGAFAAGDTLVAIETEKANVDVPAETGGVLLRHLVDAGARVEVGSPIALLGALDEIVEDIDRALSQLGLVGATAVGASPAGAVGTAVEGGSSQQAQPGVFREAGGAPHGGRVFASPIARRLARDAGIDLADLTGTGPGGRIRKADVEGLTARRVEGSVPMSATVAAPAPTTRPAATSAGPGLTFPEGADEVLVPMTQMRKGIAAQMTRALQVPHAYVQMEVDLSGLVKLRDRSKRDYQAREGLPLSFVPFVVKASAEGLKKSPTFNAHWTDQGLLAKRRINIGIAVAVEGGLIVPVIRDVDGLSISGINKAIADVSERARVGKLRVDDFGGGTFTVDNTGWLGTNMVMPIINVPEVGIVTMDRITKRPVVVETAEGDVIAIRPIMNMVLGVDHRANDGAGGAGLLRDIKAWLEAVGPETAIY